MIVKNIIEILLKWHICLFSMRKANNYRLLHLYELRKNFDAGIKSQKTFVLYNNIKYFFCKNNAKYFVWTRPTNVDAEGILQIHEGDKMCG